MSKGDIVLVRFPFTDLSSSKVRPALVLVEENEMGDLCLAFITSKTEKVGEYDIPVSKSVKTGLKTDSIIRLNKITTLHEDIVVGKIGTLPKKYFPIIEEKLMSLFKIS